MKLLAGDVGGTKVLLQLVDVTPAGRVVTMERRFESGAYATFDALLRDFLTDGAAIDAACFAVAGPVIERRAEITNLQWVMEAGALAEAFGIGRVALINDFYAVALGVPLLASGDLLSLQAGHRVPGAPIAILGAGTGLGQANVFFVGERWIVVPSEGGHGDFGPQDDEQARLFSTLLERYGHVSWERLVSGMGLQNIYDFLTGVPRPYDETFPATIAQLAEGGDATAQRAFEIFIDIYGAEAGNMALRLLARGGVFLAGGIAAKNVPRFTDGRFLRSFRRKGRFEPLLTEIPVDLIMNPKVGLIGAAEMAERTMKDKG